MTKLIAFAKKWTLPLGMLAGSGLAACLWQLWQRETGRL